jgi:hypothetical protein
MAAIAQWLERDRKDVTFVTGELAIFEPVECLDRLHG